MLELLSPAGSPEAVIAAVQNGADAVYMGLDSFNARRNAQNFSKEEFIKAVKYCHVRGCKVYVTLNTLINDNEMQSALKAATFASDAGADAILVQDFGLVSVLRESVPDIPLHASTQMSIHSLEGVKAAEAIGLKRVVINRELPLEQIKYICENSNIEIEVFVHGALCFCHSGQCYMSAMIGRRSGNRGMCAQPCRMQYSLGGRMDNYPLSLKDNCLVKYLKELNEAGVTCVKIEGRMKRPEYVAIATGVYSRAIKENRQPTSEEMELLETAFSRQGFTDGYLTGKKDNMFGVREKQDGSQEKLFNSIRKEYADKEEKRVKVKIYTRVRKNKCIQAVCIDEDGNKSAVEGPVPEIAKNQSLKENTINMQMTKTGGTPYECVQAQSRVEEGLYVSASTLNKIRRNLISQLTELRGQTPKRRSTLIPFRPLGEKEYAEPKFIFQVLKEEQLTEELAEFAPSYLYVPMELMLSSFNKVKLFIEKGTIPVAVMPRIIYDRERTDVQEKLTKLFDLGVNEALCSTINSVILAKQANMKVRADFGMNVFNTWSLDFLRKYGIESATASFELRLAQVRDLIKVLDTELIVYGRLPLMVSDQCIISRSAGRCNCQNDVNMSDRMGSVFPVMKEYGCRNVIYNAHKLFLADKMDDLYKCGLWGLRLMFTTENSNECVEVAKCYCNKSKYRPNVLTRGLYYRGVE